MSEIYLLTTVTKRALGRRFLSCYEHNGLSAVLCTLAKGTATSEILDCLGLEMTPASAAGRCSGFFWTDRRMREKRRM